MFLKVADKRNEQSWASRLRRKRTKALLDMIPADKTTRILDVGGTELFWKNVWLDRFPDYVSITLLNLTQPILTGAIPVDSVAGDARDLSRLRGMNFDICFSNSVIEHVGTLYDQLKVAAEIRAVAKRYFVQTPYRYFPIEPHFHFPLWPVLPITVCTALHRRYDLGWVKAEKAICGQERTLSRSGY